VTDKHITKICHPPQNLVPISTPVEIDENMGLNDRMSSPVEYVQNRLVPNGAEFGSDTGVVSVILSLMWSFAAPWNID
jgi:hypothetical protein